jgi:hypothetical protein
MTFILGGIVVACLLMETRIEGSNPAEDNRFIRETKIRTAILFGGEVKPPSTCRKILRHVKETFDYERDTSSTKFSGHFSPSSS